MTSARPGAESSSGPLASTPVSTLVDVAQSNVWTAASDFDRATKRVAQITR